MNATDTQILLSRVERVCARMRDAGLRQTIISAPPSIFYLTGLKIAPYERMLALLLESNGTRTLFANPLFAIDVSALPFECVLIADNGDPIAELVKRVAPGPLGIDKDWPARFLLSLMKQRPSAQPRLGSFAVDETRMIKDDVEIWSMQAASRLNDKVMSKTVNRLHEGMTEIEVAAILADNYAELRADLPIGELVVCFGAAASDPHHKPTRTALTRERCVLMDIFTPVDGYWCDMTRTVYLGTPSDEEVLMYQLVLAANEAAIRAVRPGVPLREIDRAARSVIKDGGYGEFFTHRTGHGIGLELHEAPDVSATSDTLCAPGMIFSVEPGIYKPGLYGVRIEDLVLVTETGCEVLNTYPKDMRVLL